MHPKQIPGIIAASMLLTLVIMATIGGALLDWYLVVACGAFIIALIGIMIGRLAPKPYDHSINDIIKSMRTVVSKLDDLTDSVDRSPLAVRERHNALVKNQRNMKKALGMLLQRNTTADPARHVRLP